MQQYFQVDLQCLTSPENPEIHTVIFQKIPQQVFPPFYFPGHMHISFEFCGIPSAPVSHCERMGQGDLGVLGCADIPSLAQETISEPEGKGRRKQEAVGNTESLAIKKKDSTIVLLL